ASFRAPRGGVVLPASTEEVVGCVKLAHEAGVPIVARGSGTGLSGGALPVPGCVLIGLSRMRKMLEVDFDNAFLRVQPGVINLEVSKSIGPRGWYYAPDPSSPTGCSIAGHVPEDSGW